ncbi:mitochondrial import inner membrane translocase subunit TIM50 [Kwoniella heveanensis BCC8398]|uniref:Mitochondrial import inner membrane translocase subunit TIM50 n=1 Tax=Kwoniella heveanensis BCC8398 TaxID=1296120 RepID=A0A1B9GVA8_9TREE|nr:mitochondrial import inner membrane translocase subunit TIM50 [Kwoniella heveanensis BCC8398]
MLRQASTRLFTPALRSYRPLTTTSPALIKVRSSKPSGSSSSSQPAKPAQPSPAERPPTPPDNITSPPPFEPTATSPSPATPVTHPPISENEPTSAPEVPLTPPEPPATSATEPAAEAADATPTDYSKLKLPSLDIDPEAQVSIAEPEPTKAEEEQRRTGAGKKEYVSSMEKRRRMWIRYGYGALLVGGVAAIYAQGGSQEGQAESKGNFISDFKQNMSDLLDYFNKPAFKTLLPDPLPPPHQRPYTLVIDMEGLLVHSSWDRQHGWRTIKRPGVDYFLGYLSQFYEIVLFTNQPLYTAAPVAEKLDPYQAFLPYRLFRESTRYVNGKVVKDLSYLNRDLSKVILFDTNAEHAELQPENSIIIKPWDGTPRDKGLVEMIPFLESIGIFSPADVRPILKAYQGKNIPVEYAKKEAEAKQKAVEEWERLHPTAVAGAGSGWLSSMFGSVAAPGQQRSNQPMTYLEQKRAQAQKIYQEEQKYWAEHADEFKQLIEEDKQRQLAEMKGSLLGMLGGGPKPADPAPEQKQK